MAKKQVEELEELDEINGNVAEPTPQVTAPKEEVTAPANDKAYSIVFDEKSKRWQAIELMFNHETGTLGGMKVIEENPNKYIIVDRFQVLVGKNLL